LTVTVFAAPKLVSRKSAVNVTGGAVTVRSFVRSKTCRPCWPLLSETI
jgi:hypothetical protein